MMTKNWISYWLTISGKWVLPSHVWKPSGDAFRPWAALAQCDPRIAIPYETHKSSTWLHSGKFIRWSLLIDVQEMEQMVTEILETARLKSEHDQLNREKTNLAKLIQGSCLAFIRTCTGDSFWKCSGNVSGFRRRGTNTNRIEKFIGQCAKIFKCGKCSSRN